MKIWRNLAESVKCTTVGGKSDGIVGLGDEFVCGGGGVPL